MGKTSADADPWCEERLHGPMEDLRLARLFSVPEMRAAITAVAAIYIELEVIGTNSRDMNVARTKLAWWQEEFARLAAGHPAHPATQLLGEHGILLAENLLPDLATGAELNLLAGAATDLASAEMRAERGCARLAPVLGALLDANGANDYAPLGKAIGLARTLTTPLSPAVFADIAQTARNTLIIERTSAAASPRALRVLAALAWHRASQPETGTRIRYSRRRRVFIAWRAARGKLPGELRKTAI